MLGGRISLRGTGCVTVNFLGWHVNLTILIYPYAGELAPPPPIRQGRFRAISGLIGIIYARREVIENWPVNDQVTKRLLNDLTVKSSGICRLYV